MGRSLIAMALVLAACGFHGGDACEQAAERLQRLDDLHQRRHPAWMDDEILRQCRAHGWDPVVNCAIAGPTDEAAEVCIERGVRATLHVDRDAAPPAPAARRGLNPLLDE